MDRVVVVLECEEWARVSLLEEGEESQRESGALNEIPALMLALMA